MLTGRCSFGSSVEFIESLSASFTTTQFAPLCMLSIIVSPLIFMEANKKSNNDRMETKWEDTDLHKLMPLVNVVLNDANSDLVSGAAILLIIQHPHLYAPKRAVEWYGRFLISTALRHLGCLKSGIFATCFNSVKPWLFVLLKRYQGKTLTCSVSSVASWLFDKMHHVCELGGYFSRLNDVSHRCHLSTLIIASVCMLVI